MMTYTFEVISEDNPMKDHEDEGCRWHVGDIVEIELRISEYDAFKEETASYLKRYMASAPGIIWNDASGHKGPDGRFMERLDRIRHTYPGAKNMFDDAKYRPKREW